MKYLIHIMCTGVLGIMVVTGNGIDDQSSNLVISLVYHKEIKVYIVYGVDNLQTGSNK